MSTPLFFLMLFLTSGSALAQRIPDFSGVFLRERIEDRGVVAVDQDVENPLILDIKQDAGTLRITEIQHDIHATVTYDLSGKATMNASPDGMRSKDHVKCDRGRLTLKSDWSDPDEAAPNRSTEQTWKLSSDLQTLSIQPKIEPGGRMPLGFSRIAVFARQASLAVQSYDGTLALQVIPFVQPHPQYLFSTMGAVMGWGAPHLPDGLLNLRFRLQWAGVESRDLGEVPAELGHLPWPDESHPRTIYQIAVPAQGVPLTDSLEIHILSAAGTQLGCIHGHI